MTTTPLLSRVIQHEKPATSIQTTSRESKESENEIYADIVSELPTLGKKESKSDDERPKGRNNSEVSEDEEESKEFLKFLELEPPESKTFKRGRTACTISKKLVKPPNFDNFGFSICWMNPPR